MDSVMAMNFLAAIAARSNIPIAPVETDDDDDDENLMPWEREGWVPKTSTGKIKSPNMIRNALQKYIDSSDKTQTYIMNNELQVNNNSFRRFMNPKNYKNQWSATENGTYWAAAKLLEKHAYEKKHATKKMTKKAKPVATTSTSTVATTSTTTPAPVTSSTTTPTTTTTLANKPKSVADFFKPKPDAAPTSTSTTASTAEPAKKRKSDASDGPSPPKKAKKTTTTPTVDMEAYMTKVQEVTLPEDSKVFDSCPQIIKKIKDFLQRDGVSKAAFCRILGDLNHNSLNRFLTTKNQDGAGMVAYERAYRFFEKMRLLEAKPKSKARIENEMVHSNGFALKTPYRGTYIFVRRL